MFHSCFLTHRLQRLEESLKDEPEEQKSEKRAQHAVKETEFLRLKRSKLGVDDFDPIKVIGRGAFGEVKTAGREREREKALIQTSSVVSKRPFAEL